MNKHNATTKHHSTYSKKNNHVPQEEADDLTEFGSASLETLTQAARQASQQFQGAMGAAQTFAKENPVAAAAAMFGIGAIAGALVQRLSTHRPGVAEVLGLDTLPSRAQQALSRYL